METISTKLQAQKLFNDLYSEMNETKKELFARLANKLINENFIYGQLESDSKDYYSILNNSDCLNAYFKIIDYVLVLDTVSKIAYIKTSANRNRTRLKKIETVLLLIFRKLYFIKSRTVELTTNISVSISEVVDSLIQTQIYQDKPNKSDISKALRALKDYKIIDFETLSFQENSVIRIFPTVNLVVNADSINQLNSALSDLKSKEVTADDVNED